MKKNNTGKRDRKDNAILTGKEILLCYSNQTCRYCCDLIKVPNQDLKREITPVGVT